MRHYVVVASDDPRIKPHIIAEVVRDFGDDGGDPRESLAGQLAGPRAKILTKGEILEMPDGSRILQDWQNGQDANFHMEAARLAREADDGIITRARLRLVGADEEMPRMERLGSQSDRLLRHAAELHLQSADLIERVRVQRMRVRGMFHITSLASYNRSASEAKVDGLEEPG
jgi:hypothetical protein